MLAPYIATMWFCFRASSNDRGPRRAVKVDGHSRHVDPVASKLVQKPGAEDVVPYPSHHPHAGAQPGRGDGLVGALPARSGIERFAYYRLPGHRQPGSGTDQVNIDSAEDDDGWGVFGLLHALRPGTLAAHRSAQTGPSARPAAHGKLRPQPISPRPRRSSRTLAAPSSSIGGATLSAASSSSGGAPLTATPSPAHASMGTSS